MNHDDFSDLLGIPTPSPEKPKPPAKLPNGHGGSRARAGGKPKAVRDATEEHHIKYTKSRAENETFKAANSKLDYEIKIGKYVLRDDVRRAVSVAFATIAQNLRSMPDNLERRLGLAPEVINSISIEIDEIMNNLASELEELHKHAEVAVVETIEESSDDD